MGCSFCPKVLLKDQWSHGDLPLELFVEEIEPLLEHFEWVYLQGWGEPLLHPDMWEMAALVKHKGSKVGFTTNGIWMDEEAISRIIDIEVDVVSISFAGGQKSTHESLRTGSNWEELLKNTTGLIQERKKNQNKSTWVEAHFLMIRDNLVELPDFIHLASDLGVDEVVATNLTCIPTLELDRSRAFADSLSEDHKLLISSANKAAEEKQISFRMYPLEMNPLTTVCSARPVDTVFINHRGDIAPCVYLGMVGDAIPRFFRGEAYPLNPVYFGNIRDKMLTVLENKLRRSFINTFIQRERSTTPLFTFLTLSGGDHGDFLPPEPPPCSHCYKMFGV
jgi:MoaA/NifB/PqqE/SkfB family radical SAM enzyme